MSAESYRMRYKSLCALAVAVVFLYAFAVEKASSDQFRGGVSAAHGSAIRGLGGGGRGTGGSGLIGGVFYGPGGRGTFGGGGESEASSCSNLTMRGCFNLL